MASKPKPPLRRESGLTRPGDLYVTGDDIPVPEVTEKNTDSVWALWSDLVEDGDKNGGKEGDQPEQQKDFGETVPMDFDGLATTAIMPLPDLPKDKDD